jgi:amino acid transporter
MIIEYKCNTQRWRWVLFSILGILTFINVYSVRAATRIQDIFTVAKILALIIITLTGIVLMCQGKSIFSYIVAVSFFGGGNHWPATSHWQTLSHNVISSAPCLSGIWTHNASGDRPWLHR